jgi:OOP family OmpA-OmpF porin
MGLWRGVLLGSVFLITAVSSSFAQSGFTWVPGGLYLRGDVGGAVGNDLTFKDTNTNLASPCILCTGTVHSTTRDTVIFGAGIGYRFAPMFRADLTLDYMPSFKVRGTSIGGPFPGTTYSADLSSLVGMANGYLDFNGFAPQLFGPFQPYLDGGIGFAHNDLQSSTGRIAGVVPFTQTGASRTNFAWGVGAGLAYAFTRNWALDVAYKYLDLGDLRSGASASALGVTAPTTAIKSDNFTVHTVTIGFRYTFAPPPPPPTPVVAPPPPPGAVAPQRQTFIVFFEFDKSSLTADGRRVVDAAAAAFKSGKSSVAIAGYTDLSGTQQYNLALSKRRADTVRSALVRDGVPAAAINESWHGKENPRVPTADGVREPQNRRVEINM